MEQYILLNPLSMDLKCEFVLTQSLATSDFNVNVGQETSLTEGQGERMVSQLCKDIEEHSYRVYCYNIFLLCLALGVTSGAPGVCMWHSLEGSKSVP